MRTKVFTIAAWFGFQPPSIHVWFFGPNQLFGGIGQKFPALLRYAIISALHAVSFMLRAVRFLLRQSRQSCTPDDVLLQPHSFSARAAQLASGLGGAAQKLSPTELTQPPPRLFSVAEWL